MAPGIQRDLRLKQDKVHSENNIIIAKGVNNLKNSSVATFRRPVLNDISSNLQTNKNDQKGKIAISKSTVAITKPITRLTSNLNRKTTNIASKIKPTSKTVNSGLSENVSNIPKVITKHKTKTVGILKPYSGTITRSSSLRIKSAVLSDLEAQKKVQIQKKEQEWITACKVDNVDEKDEFDPYLVGAYCKQIFEYLMTLEEKSMIKPDYLANHKHITPSNRSAVIDWLVALQQEFKLLHESLFTAVGILDRYLQENQNVVRDKFQLIGATSLLLACKYEEIYVPEISTFVYLSDNAFTIDDVKSSLVDVFKTVNYSLSKPFSLTFLRRFSKVFGAHRLHHAFAKYFLELSLIEYKLVHIKPSEMAMSALLLAIVISNEPELDNVPKDIKELLSIYWTDVMQKHSTYKMVDLVPTIQVLANLVFNASECKYKAIYDKYQSAKMGRIASNPVLRSPAMRFIAHIC